MTKNDCRALLREKLGLLYQILEAAKADHSDCQATLGVVEDNKARFLKLKKIDEALLECDIIEVDKEKELRDEIIACLLDIQRNQGKLIEKIKAEKNEAGRVIEQFAKKRQIANSYVNADREPVFVDKDFC
jgi:hypothetical protein